MLVKLEPGVARSTAPTAKMGFSPYELPSLHSSKGSRGGPMSTTLPPLQKVVPQTTLDDPKTRLKLSYADLQVSGWQTPQLRHASIYHSADLCNVQLPLADLEKILKRIPLCLRAFSIQAKYMDDPVSAALLTLEDIELHLCLWKSRTDQDMVIIEIQRRRGDAVLSGRYARKILEAIQVQDFQGSDYQVDTSLNIRHLQDAESLVHQALASSSASSAPYKGLSGSEQTVMVLDTVHSYLHTDRLDARLLGLEFLCILTDPRRTSIATSIACARAVLLGEAPTEDSEAICGYLHKFVMRLVQLREFGDENFGQADPMDVDSEAENFFPSDDDEEPSESKRPPEYVEFMSQLFRLALTVMINSIEVVACFKDQEPLCHGNLDTMTQDFIASAKEICEQDMLQTLVDFVARAKNKQHNAYLATKGLRYLWQASPAVRLRLVKDFNVVKLVEEAAQIGYTRHALLQSEGEQLFQVLAL
jgi:hypothetical protein